MSELIDARRNLNSICGKLLTTVSVFALMPYVGNSIEAKADGADNPTIWIELGGQLERQTGQGDVYAPPFLVNYPSSDAYKPVSPLKTEKPPLFSNGAEARLSFAPEGSDWVFSASVRYGRANGGKSRQEAVPYRRIRYALPSFISSTLRCCHTSVQSVRDGRYSDATVTHRDSHAILDFEAARDVGLGLLGRQSDSFLGFGVRFAQFTAKSNVALHAEPDATFYNGAPTYFLHRFPDLYVPARKDHVFQGNAASARSFRGVGPVASWDSSLGLLGDSRRGEFTFDWGANAAVLFGKRKTQGQHHESGHYEQQEQGNSQYYSNSAPFDRKSSVIVPNVGGFAGLSFRFPNAKVSVGYRGDFYFGAMDTGIDTAHRENVGFYGPFASISIGIGG